MNDPYCRRCDLKMIQDMTKRNTWKCFICFCVYERCTKQQFDMRFLAKLDQMIAENIVNQSVIKKIRDQHEERIKKSEEFDKKYKVEYGPIETWTYKTDVE